MGESPVSRSSRPLFLTAGLLLAAATGLGVAAYCSGPGQGRQEVDTNLANSRFQDVEPREYPQTLPPIAGSLRTGESESHHISLGTASGAILQLIHSSGSLRFSAVGPSGQTVQAMEPDSTMSRGMLGMMGMSPEAHLLWLAIENGETGVWKLEIAALEVPDTADAVNYVIMGIPGESDLKLQPLLLERATPLGSPLPIRLRILDQGAPVPDAEVIARLGRMESREPAGEVTLLDDGESPDEFAGDGVYTGLANEVRTPGHYTVVYHVVRPPTGETVGEERVVSGSATVSRSASRLTGAVREGGLDADGNGFLESVHLGIGVSITDSMQYAVICKLKDSTGQFVDAKVETALTPDVREVVVPIDGNYFTKFGRTGPLTFEYVLLWEMVPGDFLGVILDRTEPDLVTEAYSTEMFEGERPLRISHLDSAEPIDLDGNGLFDLLRVRIAVFTTRPGVYDCDGWLETGGRVSILPMRKTPSQCSLRKGMNLVELDFSGYCIREFGTEGEYEISWFNVAGRGGSGVNEFANTMRLDGTFDPSTFEARGSSASQDLPETAARQQCR